MVKSAAVLEEEYIKLKYPNADKEFLDELIQSIKDIKEGRIRRVR